MIVFFSLFCGQPGSQRDSGSSIKTNILIWKSLKIEAGHSSKTSATSQQIIGFEILTVVVRKSTVLRHTTQCSPLKGNQGFGGTYRLHLQGRISRARYQHKSKLIRSWIWRRCSSETSADLERTIGHYIPEYSTRLYDITVRINTVLSFVAVRTSYLTFSLYFKQGFTS
jgi:hypothetical protein